ncbi:DUF6516 family protein [Halococcus dombrowskii]|uniref:DUF6516 family protein n=1 Tax=Halococcus dombrowskii TaxID=179637 RepID=A0AAV3SEW8_HALDO|nr:DUF6516 family protein [Halococcus dombrowskii]UOO95735.1 DUF6516 family protein [Halococcus dombrowskii]
MPDGESNIDTVLDETRKEDNRIIHRKVILVPESSEYPDGVKYTFHYGTLDDETLLRYDNSHGWHERHVGDSVEEIEYPGIAELYEQFVNEIEGM